MDVQKSIITYRYVLANSAGPAQHAFSAEQSSSHIAPLWLSSPQSCNSTLLSECILTDCHICTMLLLDTTAIRCAADSTADQVTTTTNHLTIHGQVLHLQIVCRCWPTHKTSFGGKQTAAFRNHQCHFARTARAGSSTWRSTTTTQPCEATPVSAACQHASMHAFALDMSVMTATLVHHIITRIRSWG